MTKYKTYLRHGKDNAAAELIAALLQQPTYLFSELFHAVHERLKARKVSNVGEDMLRLRVYEKLQAFVAEGLVNKSEKRYSGLQPALLARVDEMAHSRALQEERKRVNLNVATPIDPSPELPV